MHLYGGKWQKMLCSFKYLKQCSAEEISMLYFSSIFQPVKTYNSINNNRFSAVNENTVDPNQMASSEAI